MSVTALALAYHARQDRYASTAARLAQAWWAAMTREDMDGYWRSTSWRLLAELTGLQEQAAADTDAYVTGVLRAEDVTARPAGRINPGAFAGYAADGRPLATLLYEPIIQTRALLAQGVPAAQAFASGAARMALYASSELADTGRSATGARIASDRSCTGYVRVVSATCCARCAVLAGRVYAFNRGFARHRRCHCVHMPTSRGRRGKSLVSDPREHFNRLSLAEQNRIYGKHGAQAIRDGADIARVVNSRRGVYTADVFGRRVKATHELTAQAKRHARKYGRTPSWGAGPRLTPEAIYKIASNRAEVVRLLIRNGYIYP
ncbi:hypothetical protein ACPCTH_33550 [Streptomyces cellulosae]